MYVGSLFYPLAWIQVEFDLAVIGHYNRDVSLKNTFSAFILASKYLNTIAFLKRCLLGLTVRNGFSGIMLAIAAEIWPRPITVTINGMDACLIVCASANFAG